ncbi:MAG: glutamate racemase [Tannerella sp.]|jgi:glutamate racemase|nr:glutamate racemase [Tannerella sp.]
MKEKYPIGIFDSGYGGLTIFGKIRELLPQYDYVYLGDNARAPYGTRSFEIVYQFTRQAVMRLFDEGCPLVIIACNTASAKALRTIQQQDLPRSSDPSRRTLGIIRPTAEALGSISRSRHIGLLATTGTIASESYRLEMAKLYPDVTVTGEACPMWAPLVENREYGSDGADYFVRKNIEHLFAGDPVIDTLALACTHYPLLEAKIRKYMPAGVTLFSQGACVADSLKDYLARHPEMSGRLTKTGNCRFMTTESVGKFAEMASIFFDITVEIEHITLK